MAGSVVAPIMTSVHQPPTTRPRYPSDLSDTAWWRIRPLVVPVHEAGGRPCAQARWREYVDVLLYIARTSHPVAGAAARLHRHLVRRPQALHQVDQHRAVAAPAASAARRDADPRRQEAEADRRDRGLLVQ